MGQLNYLNKEDDNNKKQQKSSRPSAAPDQIVHTPPFIHYILGGFGAFFGAGANIWQMCTTFLAVVEIASPAGSQINYWSLGWKLAIALLIAISTQLGLTFMVWRIDSTWKRKYASSPAIGSKSGGLKGYGLATIEVLQHVDLVTTWGLIAFVTDTVGDYTFAANTLQGVPLLNMIGLIALYAVGLYALSTIGFVRSVEYLWAGLISTARYVQQAQGSQQGQDIK